MLDVSMSTFEGVGGHIVFGMGPVGVSICIGVAFLSAQPKGMVKLS